MDKVKVEIVLGKFIKLSAKFFAPYAEHSLLYYFILKII